jgi:hypothetical protein
MLSTPKGLSDEKATRMMAALRGGRTLRKFAVKAWRLQAYFESHPDYAREVLPLIKANATATRLRKGSRLREMTQFFCVKGLHPMMGENVRIDPSRGRRACLACRKAAAANEAGNGRCSEAGVPTRRHGKSNHSRSADWWWLGGSVVKSCRLSGVPSLPAGKPGVRSLYRRDHRKQQQPRAKPSPD